MGWLFYAATQQDLIQDRLRSDPSNPHIHRQILASKLITEQDTQVLWYVVKCTAQTAQVDWLELGQSQSVICCDLIECHDGCWGYKSLDEACHPFYYSCPLTFLDLAPVVQSQDWRNRVLAYHKAQQ